MKILIALLLAVVSMHAWSAPARRAATKPSAKPAAKPSVKPAAAPVELLDNDSCLPINKVTEILTQFKIYNMAGIPWDEAALCDRKNIMFRTIKALIFLKDGQYSKPKPDPAAHFNYELKDPFAYFSERIRDIYLLPSCPPGVFAYVINKIPRIHICAHTILRQETADQYYEPIVFAESLIHEARHVDEEDPGHVTCNQGPLNGREGCDNGRSARGGFHYAVEYLLLVSRHGKNFDPKVRDLAYRKAMFHLSQKFNTHETAPEK